LGGGTASLLEEIRTDEGFRHEVAAGDIIAITTGVDDGSVEIERGRARRHLGHYSR
jgi:hypothetical protein